MHGHTPVLQTVDRPSLSQDRFFSVFARLGDGDGSHGGSHGPGLDAEAADACREGAAKRILGELAMEQSFVQPLSKFLDTSLGKPMPAKFQAAYQPLQAELFAQWGSETVPASRNIGRFLALVEKDPRVKRCYIDIDTSCLRISCALHIGTCACAFVLLCGCANPGQGRQDFHKPRQGVANVIPGRWSDFANAVNALLDSSGNDAERTAIALSAGVFQTQQASWQRK